MIFRSINNSEFYKMASQNSPLSIPLNLKVGSATIPQIGFGTFKLNGEDATNAVKIALRTGYRHIDTAEGYKNHEEVGLGVREFLSENPQNVKRQDLFITTKMWPKAASDLDNKSATDVMRESVANCLSDLDVEYVDLFLIHWPTVTFEPEKEINGGSGNEEYISDLRFEMWQVLDEFVKKGLIKALGVSNFGLKHLAKLMAKINLVNSGHSHHICLSEIAVNQIELSPGCWEEFDDEEDENRNEELFLGHGTCLKKLISFCKSHQIVLEAFSPIYFGGDGLLQNATVLRIAKSLSDRNPNRNITPAQICLRWGIQKGFVVLPKSGKEARIEENFQIFDFELSELEMEELSNLGIHKRSHPLCDASKYA